ncbi:MAG: acyltransferase [Altibacter sp.]|nr:acyltransferase [Altibacter sp.]
MTRTYSERIFGLDLMRAIAIISVVLGHALWIYPDARGGLVPLLKIMAVSGVELFFVLSGFLIGRILFKIFTSETFHLDQLKYFLVRRWFRTLPNYYLVLLVNILLVLYLGRSLPESVFSYFFFLQNFSSGMGLFFTESWSLPIEEFAYIIGPFLLYLSVALPLKIAKTTRFLYVTLLIITFFMITKLVYHFNTGSTTPDQWNTQLKAVVLYRIDSIYIGVLAAYVSITRPLLWKKNKGVLALSGMVLFCGMLFCIAFFQLGYETHPFVWNVLYLPIGSLAMAFMLPYLSQWKQSRGWWCKSVTFISIISYSMYLLHYSIILQIMRNLISIDGLGREAKALYVVVYFGITIVLSYLLYRFYEKPMMDLRDRPGITQYFRR